MLENPVLFAVGAESWTLAGVCLATGAVCFVVAGSLLALLLARHGKSRRLSGAEASRVGLRESLADQTYLIQGPAAGVEARVSFSIGDLRRARQAGDRLVFWGAPLMLMTWTAAFGLACLACILWTGDYVFAVAYLVLVPMFLIACFMPWAAVYTKLE